METFDNKRTGNCNLEGEKLPKLIVESRTMTRGRMYNRGFENQVLCF